MATKKKSAAQKKIGKVMREYGKGILKSSNGDKVKTQAQALAIAMSEAEAMKRGKRK